MIWKDQAFSICHLDQKDFIAEGLRPFFAYRNLGVNEATRGKYGAHVIRAIPGKNSSGAWHTHELDFQLVYVTKGWVVFEYEQHGEHTLNTGSCVLQPPGILHREVRHSDDLELLEITSPASFSTRSVDDPE